MNYQHTPYPPGYLAYGAIDHATERDHVCDMCGVSFRAGINAETCASCKATEPYHERKRAQHRKHMRWAAKRRRQG